MLLQDIHSDRVDPVTLPWDQPVFVLRSANMARMRAFLRQVAIHCVSPALHVMSHARDEDTIRAMTTGAFTFHPYPTPGPYTLDEVPASTLDRLRSTGFGTLVLLDPGPADDRLDDVVRLLAAIAESRTVSFDIEGTYARTANWRQRKRAHAAFLGLVEWYHLKLDPGFPDGAVLPGDAIAPSLK